MTDTHELIAELEDFTREGWRDTTLQLDTEITSTSIIAEFFTREDAVKGVRDALNDLNEIAEEHGYELSEETVETTDDVTFDFAIVAYFLEPVEDEEVEDDE
jgi:hypothetical protein